MLIVFFLTISDGTCLRTRATYHSANLVLICLQIAFCIILDSKSDISRVSNLPILNPSTSLALLVLAICLEIRVSLAPLNDV
jgi:hypothetical protein